MIPNLSGWDAVRIRPRVDVVEPWSRTLGLLPTRQTAVGVAKVGLVLGLLARPPGRTIPLVALLTVAVYAHNDLTDLAEDGVNEPARADAVDRRAHGIRFAVVAAAAGALGVAATGGIPVVLLALVPVCLGVCYNASVLPGPGPDRLKDVLVVNTAATAAAWAVPVALLPVAFASASATRVVDPGRVAWFACGYLFVRTFVASEFANVPDADGDAAAGVRTLPVALGPTATRWVLLGANGLTVVGVGAAVATGLLPVLTALALAAGLVLSGFVILPRADPVTVERLPALADHEFALAAVALVLVRLS